MFICLFPLLLVGIKPGTSYILGKYPTIELLLKSNAGYYQSCRRNLTICIYPERKFQKHTFLCCVWLLFNTMTEYVNAAVDIYFQCVHGYSKDSGTNGECLH